MMVNELFTEIFQITLFSLCLFVVFEYIPLLFWNIPQKIKSNFKDFILYHIGRGVYSVMIGFVCIYGYIKLGIFGQGIDIGHLTIVSQVILLYLCIEFVIYCSHMCAHKYKIPFLTRAHSFHHQTTSDMDWVNSKKEHFFVISLFVIIFTLFFFVIFNASSAAKTLTLGVYVFLNSLSHYRIRFSIPILDQIFLFPKDHYTHHTVRRSGPYGVTLSLFDTIFNTRN